MKLFVFSLTILLICGCAGKPQVEHLYIQPTDSPDSVILYIRPDTSIVHGYREQIKLLTTDKKGIKLTTVAHNLMLSKNTGENIFFSGQNEKYITAYLLVVPKPFYSGEGVKFKFICRAANKNEFESVEKSTCLIGTYTSFKEIIKNIK